MRLGDCAPLRAVKIVDGASADTRLDLRFPWSLSERQTAPAGRFGDEEIMLGKAMFGADLAKLDSTDAAGTAMAQLIPFWRD
jgi:hypothetical protein